LTVPYWELGSIYAPLKQLVPVISVFLIFIIIWYSSLALI